MLLKIQLKNIKNELKNEKVKYRILAEKVASKPIKTQIKLTCRIFYL